MKPPTKLQCLGVQTSCVLFLDDLIIIPWDIRLTITESLLLTQRVVDTVRLLLASELLSGSMQPSFSVTFVARFELRLGQKGSCPKC